MGLLERVVDVFEQRVKKLVQITTISELPQWTDADVIAADCLLKQYRSLTSEPSGRETGCGCPFREKFVDGKYLVCPNCGSRTLIKNG